MCLSRWLCARSVASSFPQKTSAPASSLAASASRAVVPMAALVSPPLSPAQQKQQELEKELEEAEGWLKFLPGSYPIRSYELRLSMEKWSQSLVTNPCNKKVGLDKEDALSYSLIYQYGYGDLDGKRHFPFLVDLDD